MSRKDPSFFVTDIRPTTNNKEGWAEFGFTAPGEVEQIKHKLMMLACFNITVDAILFFILVWLIWRQE